MIKPTLGVLTCLWQRPALTDVVLRWYQHLKSDLSEQLDLELLAVGSEGAASRALAEDNGFAYVEHPNAPLGAKWNAGLAALRERQPDAVVIVGSDDLVSGNLFILYADRIARGCQYLGLTDMYFLDLASRRLCFWPGYPPGGRHGETLGLGRCLHADLLDVHDWRLWEDGLRMGLDGSMTRRLAPQLRAEPQRWNAVAFRCLDHGIGALDIKSGLNLWSFARVVGACEVQYMDFDATLCALFPEHLVEPIRGLSGP